MKRTSLILPLLVLIMAVPLIFTSCCKNKVEEVFSQDWKKMSNVDKTEIEKFFKDKEETDKTDYWALCADYGGDTTGRENPWKVVVEAKPIKVKFYIDNSSSILGYFKSNSQVILNVLSGIDLYFHDNDITGYYIEENSLKPYKWDILLSDLRGKSLKQTSDSYQIDRLFAEIMNKSSKSERVVNFILTDGIPSGTNEEIRKSRDFNIAGSGLLRTRIANAIGSHENIAASVYQFVTEFEGVYYNCDNSKRNRTLLNRPFYIIAIGDKELVMELAEKENKGIDNFKANNKVHFGVVDHSRIDLTSIAFDSDKSSEDKKIIASSYFEGEDTKTVTMQLGLSGLPYFARTKSFFTKNAVIKINNEPLKNFTVSNELLSFDMRIEPYSQYDININVKNTTPSWVERNTCEDDRKISDKDLEFKTFNLKYLVDGIKDAVTGSYGNITLLDKTFVIDTDYDSVEE